MSGRREWGLLCPLGHGLLLERDDWTRQGVAWCSHEEHGGNGHMYRRQEVEEGWYDPSKPAVKSAWQLEQEARAARAAEARKEHEMAKAEKPEKAPAAPRTRKPKEARECKCGCGEMTKGGLFRPGHDARYHSALARAQAVEAAAKEATE